MHNCYLGWFWYEKTRKFYRCDDIIKEDDQLQMQELFNEYFGNIQTDHNARDRIFGTVMRGIRR